MSADFDARTPGCEGCGCEGHELGSWNLTYNLSPMLRAAGFPGWGDVVGKDARPVPTGRRVVPVFESVLAELLRDPATYRAMNPSNGWGTYDQAVEVFADFIETVRPHPDAVVSSWL